MSKELLAFKASWCAPCKGMEPVLNELKQEGYPVQFIDVEADAHIAAQYNVRAVPTFVVRDGESTLETLVGTKSKDDLVNALKA